LLVCQGVYAVWAGDPLKKKWVTGQYVLSTELDIWEVTNTFF